MVGKGFDTQILDLLKIPLDTRVTEVTTDPTGTAGITNGHSISLFPRSYHRDQLAHNRTYWHELGHVLWSTMSPEEKGQWTQAFSDMLRKKITSPSDYAKTSRNEFFSESFRKQMLKEDLDSKIKDLFMEQGSKGRG